MTERARSYGRYLLGLEQGTLTEIADLLEALQKKARIGALKIPKSAEIQVRTLKEFKQRVLDPPQDAAGVIGVVRYRSGSEFQHSRSRGPSRYCEYWHRDQ